MSRLAQAATFRMTTSILAFSNQGALTLTSTAQDSERVILSSLTLAKGLGHTLKIIVEWWAPHLGMSSACDSSPEF